MTDVVGLGVIQLEGDTTGFEAAMRRMEAVVNQVETNVAQRLARVAGSGSKVGDGIAAGASKAESATERFVRSIDRQTAAIAGGIAMQREIEALQKGIDPQLAQQRIATLREAIDAQEKLTQAQKATALAQREVAQTATDRSAYIASLREELALVGQTATARTLANAQRRGGAEAVQLRLQIIQETDALEQTAKATREAAAATDARTAAQQRFLATLREQIAIRPGEPQQVKLTRQATDLGIGDQAQPLIDKLAQLEEQERQTAEAARNLAAAQREAASAQKQQESAAASAQASREQYLASLREEIALIGQSNTQRQLAAAYKQGGSEGVQLKLRAIQEAEAVERSAKASREKAAADELAKKKADDFVKSLRAQADAADKGYGVLLREQAASLGVLTPEVEKYISKLHGQTTQSRDARVEANLLKQALRGLPAQFTDIATSLAGGQNPLLVFIQQGGQIKDQFGGIGAAVRGLASVLTPTRVLIGGVGVVATLVGVAFANAEKELTAFRRALVFSGNAAGTTVAELNSVARAVSQVVGTQAKAAETLAALAATGRVAREDLGKLAEAAIRLEREGGPAVEKTVEQFAELGRRPTEASRKLNEQTRFLNGTLYEQIRALEEVGRVQEAGALAQNAYAAESIKRTKELTDNLGYIERFLRGGTELAKGFWNAILNIGRTTQTPQSNLEAAEKQLAELRRRAAATRPQGANDALTGGAGEAAAKAAIAAAERQVEKLREVKRATDELAQAQRDLAAASEAAIRLVDRAKTFESPQQKLANELRTIIEDTKIAQKPLRGADGSVATRELLKAGDDEQSRQLFEATRRSEAYGLAVQQSVNAIQAAESLASQKSAQEIQRLQALREQGKIDEIELIERVAAVQEAAAKRAAAAIQATAGAQSNLPNIEPTLVALAGQARVERAKAQAAIDEAADKVAIEQQKRRVERIRAEAAAYQDAWKIAIDQVAGLQQRQEISELESIRRTTEFRVQAIEVTIAALQKEYAETRNRQLLPQIDAAQRDKAAVTIVGDIQRQNLEKSVTLDIEAQTRALNNNNQAIALEAQLIGQSSAVRADALALLSIEQNRLEQIRQIRIKLGQTPQAEAAIKGINSNAASESAQVGPLRNLREIDALLDPDRPRQFGIEFTKAFRTSGAAVQGLVNTLTSLGAAQEKNARIIRETQSNPLLNEKDRQQAINELIIEREQLQLDSYAKIAGAAKGFFEENSKGYKALEAAETAFRAFQLAQAIATTARKIFFTGAETAAVVAGEAAKTTAIASSTASQLALDQVAGASTAARAVAIQATGGDPYSAFPRMAAMAAAMAALGYATGFFGSSGGGTQATAAQRQGGAATGRVVTKDQLDANSLTLVVGTVLGDGDAKSASLQKALDSISQSSDIALEYQSGMLDSLKNIENSMAGLANLVSRVSGGALTTGRNLGIQTGVLSRNEGDPLVKGLFGINDSNAVRNLPVIGNFLVSLQGLFGKTTQSIVDSGLAIQGTIAQLAGGQGVRQFVDVQTTKSSFFGLRKTTSESTQFGSVEDQIAEQFSLVFANIGTTLEATAGVLNRQGGDLQSAIESFVVDIPRLSLKDLKGQELTDALNAAISSAADSLATSVIPGLEDFQNVGEGYYETLVRVASGVETANYELDKLGITAVDYTEIIRKQGDVSAEITRQSIVAAESVGQFVSSVGTLVQTIDGSSSDIAQTYSDLVDVRDALVTLGVSGEALTASLLRGAGGLDALAESANTFLSEFFSTEEQQAIQRRQVSTRFEDLGFDLPASRQQFRDLVAGIDTTTAAGQELLGKVLSLSEAFDAVADAADEAAEAAKKLAQELANEIRAAVPKFLSPAQQERFQYGQIAGDLAAAGVNVDVNTLIAASKAQIFEMARAFVLAAENSDEAKIAVTKAASALADLKDQAEEAAARVVSGVDSVIGDFLKGPQLAGYFAERIQSILAGGGIESSVPGILSSTRDDIVDLWGTVGTAGRQAILDAYDLWGQLDELIRGTARAVQEYRQTTLADAIEQARLGTLNPADRISRLKATERNLFAELATTDDPVKVAQRLTEVITSRISLEAKLEEDLGKEKIDALNEQLDAAKALRDVIAGLPQFIASLKFSDLSPLSPRQQLAEAQSLFESTLIKAAGGDKVAIQNLQTNAQALIQESISAYGSGPQAAAIFNRVTTALEQFSSVIGPGLDPQIEALNQQIATLDSIDNSSAKMLEALLSIDSALGGRYSLTTAPTTEVGTAIPPTTVVVTSATGGGVDDPGTSVDSGAEVVGAAMGDFSAQLIALNARMTTLIANTAPIAAGVTVDREGYLALIARVRALEDLEARILSEIQTGRVPA